MADTKITALTALTAADPANDVIPIVDVSDTSMAASGTTKKISVNNILGASGTATLASATITGDLTVDTSTLKVDSANDRVGIGTATPATNLHIINDTAATNSAVDVLTITQSSTGTAAAGLGGGVLFKSERPSGGLIVNRGAIYGVSGTDPDDDGDLAFYTLTDTGPTGFTEKVRINAIGNIVMKTANTGIDFSINSDASATSELLNDYEEGTWTPVLGGSGGTSGQSYFLQAGRYTKIGRQVVCNFEATLTAVGTVTTYAVISGLPFTSSATSVNLDGGSASISFAYNIATNQIFITGYVPGSDTKCWISSIAAAGTLIGNITATNLWANSTRLAGTITYTSA